MDNIRNGGRYVFLCLAFSLTENEFLPLNYAINDKWSRTIIVQKQLVLSKTSWSRTISRGQNLTKAYSLLAW